MNTPTNIIYKAKKAATNEWVAGYYRYKEKGNHYIHEAKTGCYYDINPDTLCIGCVIDGKEYFAGDGVSFRGLSTTGIIAYSIDGFVINLKDGRFTNLSFAINDITNIGNIHD